MTIDTRIDSAPVTFGSPELSDLIEQIGDGVIDRDDRGEPPFAKFDLIRRARLGALRLPVASGGGGATLRELFEVIISLGEADPNVAHSVRNHLGTVENLIRRPRAEDARWFDRIRNGDLFGISATELGTAHAGSPDYRYATAITETPNGLRLSGEKFYSTGNLYVDWLVVVASDQHGDTVRLIVPADRPGVVIEDDWDGIGQRFTGSGTTRFVDVAVSDDDFFAPGGFGGDVPYKGTFPQLYLTAVIAGILRRVVRDATELVRAKRRTFYHAAADNPVDDPILQQSVGVLSSQAFAAEALVLSAAEALGAATEAHGRPDEEEALSLEATLRAAKAKVVIDELANRAASELFDVGGGSTVRRSAHLDRHWRNIRTLAAHNPKTYKAKAIGAHEITGEPLPRGGFF
ncbi:acyl-CoA dehydrogenase family protein [Mycolicibacterium nivoides]|uniref:acyl-CoA dehydrogenase family protein n=1 Tax=Mycolicibacterium nivoides TaxID=2487344 RepID=UPI0008AE35CF|nr:acyl-CoA dehydrogenase family protein [Mycolicibacterium boenickei]SEQ29910.1 Acyl-CoA dehydrogenase [Mycobacterium sp. 88mf]SFF43825.1 Acyl-CoA dehydrogenase [Mycobacterium sp. 455mf]